MKPTFKLSQRATDVVYWTLGTLAMTASAAILYAKDDARMEVMALLGLGPLLLALLALPFFPDDE